MSEKIPAIVLTLAEKVKMTPIAWKIEPDHVTIVFQEGPKMVFDKEQQLSMLTPHPQTPDKPVTFIRPAPAKKPSQKRK